MLSNRFGGIGQAFIDYNECLLSLGHSVQAVCHERGGWKEVVEEQMSTHPKLERLTVKYKGGPRALPEMLKIQLAVRSYQPDVIIIHNYLRLALMATWGIAPRVGITHMHKYKHLQKVAGVIALTDTLATACREQAKVPSSRIHIIPNMIAGDIHAPMEIGSEPLTIGGLGRLDNDKGFHFLVESCILLKQQGFPFRLKLGGVGFDQEKLKKRVQQAGLCDHVQFCGMIKDKARFFGEIDVLIVPSLQEAFGIIILEGMKFGVPVIASNISGPASIITHGKTGLLVPPANPEAIAMAIRKLAVSPELAFQLAKAASYELRSKYAMDVVGNQLNSALETIIQNSND